MDRYHKIEQKKADESDRQLQRMRNKLKDEEMRILRGEKEIDENMLDYEVNIVDEQVQARKKAKQNMQKPKGDQ